MLNQSPCNGQALLLPAGQPMPVMDGLLIATAQCHGLTVVTRNVQDFTDYPQVFNPWYL